MHKTFHALAGLVLSCSLATFAFAADGKKKADGGEKAADKSQKAADNSEKRQAHADAREARQAQRIHEGIKHGQLTPDEVKKLQSQEDNLKAMDAKFNSDGKLTKDESKQLEGALNDASLQIWAQRHDTEGNQKTVSRLGNDVFAKDEITQQIESGQMTHAQAQQFLSEFRQMTNLKRRLSSDNMSDADQQKLQQQYDDYLNKYFLIKGS